MKGSKTTWRTFGEHDFGISIFDAVSGRYVVALALVLKKCCPTSHVLELLETLGKPKTLEFLDVFAGTTIEVPTQGVLEGCMRDIAIYLDLTKVTPNRRAEVVSALAAKHGLLAAEVRRIYKETDEFFKKENVDINVC